MNKLNFETTFKTAWEHFKEHWKLLCSVSAVGILIPMIILIVAFFLLLSNFSNSVHPSTDPFWVTIFGILGLLMTVVTYITMIGLMKISMMIVDGQKPTIKDMFVDSKTYGKLIVVALLCSILYSIGICLCIIPGVIFIFLSFLSPLVVIDNPQTEVIESIKKSINLVKSDWRNVLIIMLVAYILMSVVSYTILAMVAAYPFLILIIAIVYRKLNANANNINDIPYIN